MPNIVNRIYNPITGIFGTGNINMWVGSTDLTATAQTSQSITWVIPSGVGAVRVRLWGGGARNGGGGGFALKTIYDLTGLTSVTILVGFGGNATTTNGGTSSFGSFVSATGGTVGGAGGSGTGGDINFSGGSGAANNGGAASIFGPGASANTSFPAAQGFGGAAASGTTPQQGSGGSLTASGAAISLGSSNVFPTQQQRSGLEKFSIDFIGTGGGGTPYFNGINGSGFNGTTSTGINGGIPGGSGNSFGAPGMVIVEW